MNDLLAQFDSRTAVGILARAALSLQGEGNPAAQEHVKSEATIRDALIREARKALGISNDDHSPEQIERVSDYLEERSDALIGKRDLSGVYERLLESGNLPSDLFRIQIENHLPSNLAALWPGEKTLIEKTIRQPTREQHFGNHKLRGEPNLISLFARPFYTPFPFKNFIMLVAAQRMKDFTLTVPQAWRIYPALVNLANAKDLVEYLQRFADRYGFEITLGDKKGKFFLSSEVIPPPAITIDRRGRKEVVTVTHFFQRDPVTKEQTAALTIATNLDQYLNDVRKMDAPIIG